MKYLIRIQSFSDIITNSSSEVFLVKKSEDITFDELKNFLKNFHVEHLYKGDWDTWDKMPYSERMKFDSCSGMGGIFELQTYEDALNSPSEWGWSNTEYFDDVEDKEKYLLVDTDNSHYATNNWIETNLNAIRID